MPYIKSHFRLQFGSTLEQFDQLLDAPRHVTVGGMNFLVTKLVHRFLQFQGETTYANLNGMIGMLECCKQELYRRIAAPYEDQKIVENGDVV